MMVARSEGAVETESRDSGDIEGTEVMRYWDGRGVQHDPRFWFGPLGYWWNMTGTTGAGMGIDSVGGCAEYEGPVAFPGGCSEGSQM